MPSKLTLSIDPSVIAQAKLLADEQGLSVSRLFSDFIRDAQRRTARRGARVATPVLNRLTGIIKLSSNDQRKSDRELITDALAERHGL